MYIPRFVPCVKTCHRYDNCAPGPQYFLIFLCSGEMSSELLHFRESPSAECNAPLPRPCTKPGVRSKTLFNFLNALKICSMFLCLHCACRITPRVLPWTSPCPRREGRPLPGPRHPSRCQQEHNHRMSRRRRDHRRCGQPWRGAADALRCSKGALVQSFRTPCLPHTSTPLPTGPISHIAGRLAARLR